MGCRVEEGQGLGSARKESWLPEGAVPLSFMGVETEAQPREGTCPGSRSQGSFEAPWSVFWCLHQPRLGLFTGQGLCQALGYRDKEDPQESQGHKGSEWGNCYLPGTSERASWRRGPFTSRKFWKMMIAGQVEEVRRRPSQAVGAVKQRAEEQGHEGSCGGLLPPPPSCPFYLPFSIG